MFQWAHFERIDALLDQEADDDVYEAVMDALDVVINDPFEPTMTLDHRGTTREPPNRVALRPHGYVMSLRVYPQGIPPWRVPMLSVLRFRRLTEP